MKKDESKIPGGLARAEALSPERKSAIARKAAAMRWGKLPRATHKGNFKDDFGIDVDCYVLDDEQKTAVISQRGMAVAIGLSERGNAFVRFAGSKSVSPYLGAQIREKIEKPLVFQWVAAGAHTQPPSTVHGYDVTLLVDICKAILEAEAAGALDRQQGHLARQARVILNASARAGIKGLVYALAGYDATREEVIAAFKLYVREEAREYEKEFPDQLYEEWYRLYQLPKPARNKPWKFKHLTIKHVYQPLAHSNGRILDLTRAMRDKSDKQHGKLHQFLSMIGVKALRQHLGSLVAIARISRNDQEYEAYWEKLYGTEPEIPGLLD